jgi:hypothetical protein
MVHPQLFLISRFFLISSLFSACTSYDGKSLTSPVPTMPQIALPTPTTLTTATPAATSTSLVPPTPIYTTDLMPEQWSFIFEHTDGIRPTTVRQTEDNGLIVIGNIGEVSDERLWVMKLDSRLGVTWQKEIGKASSGDVLATSDGNFVLAGAAGASQDNDFWTMKLDEAGNVLWYKTFIGPHTRIKPALTACDGGFALAGISSGDITGLWAMRFASSGDMVWQKTYAPPETLHWSNVNIRATSDGGFKLFGQVNTQLIGLLEIDGNGGILRQSFYHYGPSFFAGSKTFTITGFSGIETLKDGGIVATGRGGAEGSGGPAAFIIKVDGHGKLAWRKILPASVNPIDIVETEDNLVIVGNTYRGGWIAGLNQKGELAWQSVLQGGGRYDTTFSAVYPLEGEGGYVIIGKTRCDKKDCVLLVKTNGSGEIPGCEQITLIRDEGLGRLSADNLNEENATFSVQDFSAIVQDDEATIKEAAAIPSQMCAAAR